MQATTVALATTAVALATATTALAAETITLAAATIALAAAKVALEGSVARAQLWQAPSRQRPIAEPASQPVFPWQPGTAPSRSSSAPEPESADHEQEQKRLEGEGVPECNIPARSPTACFADSEHKRRQQAASRALAVRRPGGRRAASRLCGFDPKSRPEFE